MGLRKRTQRRDSDAPASSTALSRRDEKILLMLAMHTRQLDDRLTRLEDLFEASRRDAIAQPDHQDLLELRLHSARLAAELQRVALELRTEINQLASARGEVIDLRVLDEPDDDADDAEPPHGDANPHRRVDDPIDAAGAPPPAPRPRPRRTSGWRPTR